MLGIIFYTKKGGKSSTDGRRGGGLFYELLFLGLVTLMLISIDVGGEGGMIIIIIMYAQKPISASPGIVSPPSNPQYIPMTYNPAPCFWLANVRNATVRSLV